MSDGFLELLPEATGGSELVAVVAQPDAADAGRA
jgi:hypothetical protein